MVPIHEHREGSLSLAVLDQLAQARRPTRGAAP